MREPVSDLCPEGKNAHIYKCGVTVTQLSPKQHDRGSNPFTYAKAPIGSAFLQISPLRKRRLDKQCTQHWLRAKKSSERKLDKGYLTADKSNYAVPVTGDTKNTVEPT